MMHTILDYSPNFRNRNLEQLQNNLRDNIFSDDSRHTDALIGIKLPSTKDASQEI